MDRETGITAPTESCVRCGGYRDSLPASHGVREATEGWVGACVSDWAANRSWLRGASAQPAVQIEVMMDGMQNVILQADILVDRYTLGCI